MSDSTTKTYTGGCHCGAVRYQAELDLSRGASRCNCSICTMRASTGAIVKPEAFQVLAGADSLSFYSKGGSPNGYRFCKTCGIQVFGAGDIPEVGGAFVSVNLNTLDHPDLTGVSIQYWDGRHDNWDAGPRAEPWPL